MKLPALHRCAIVFLALAALSSCSGFARGTSASVTTTVDSPAKAYEDLVVGFAQIGAESEWRTANTRSIQETARRLGVELKFADAQQQQENQTKQIRS